MVGRSVRGAIGLGRALVLASLPLALAPAPAAAAPADPLPSLNLNPLRQIVYQHPDRGPLGAVAQGELSGGLSVGYFAAFSSQERGDSSILLDLEGARFDASLGWAPTDRIRVALDLPLIVYYDGVLDSVVEVVDRAVGTPSPQRKDVGQNDYHFRYQHATDSPFQPAPGHFGLGDAALEARARLLDEDLEGWLPELSATGVVEVPSGDPSLVHGNGAVDVAGEVEAARSLGDLRISLALGFVVPGGAPDRLGGVSTRAAVSGLAAFGYAIGDAWQLLAQVDYRQSPYGGSGLDVLKADSSELAVGLRFAPPSRGLSIEAGFVEGLVNGSSPDFSVVTSIACRFDGGGRNQP